MQIKLQYMWGNIAYCKSLNLCTATNYIDFVYIEIYFILCKRWYGIGHIDASDKYGDT